MNILAIAAHPDDEILGCGATLARLAREGHEVTTAIFGEGITSRYADRTAPDRTLIDALKQHARRAGAIVGAKDVVLYDLPDNRFDTVPLLDIIHLVEALIERLRPAVVYTHHSGDLNIDHVVLNRAVLTATRALPGSFVREVYSFEIASSTEWAFGTMHQPFAPNTFVDVEATLEQKIAAMQVYESESRPFPHPRSPEALRAIAQRWGSVAGVKAAEAFQLVRAVR